MDATKKKLIIPFITFLGLLAINVDTMLNGAVKHQPWRIIVAGGSSILILALAVFMTVSLKRQKEQAKQQ